MSQMNYDGFVELPGEKEVVERGREGERLYISTGALTIARVKSPHSNDFSLRKQSASELGQCSNLVVNRYLQSYQKHFEH